MDVEFWLEEDALGSEGSAEVSVRSKLLESTRDLTMIPKAGDWDALGLNLEASCGFWKAGLDVTWGQL